MRSRLWLALGIAGLLPGCGAPHEDPVEGLRRSVEQQRRGAEVEIDRKLAALDRKMDRLRTLARSATVKKNDVRRRVKQLEQEQAELRRELERARRSGARALEDLGQSVDRTMEKLEKTLGLSEDTSGDAAGAGA